MSRGCPYEYREESRLIHGHGTSCVIDQSQYQISADERNFVLDLEGISFCSRSLVPQYKDTAGYIYDVDPNVPPFGPFETKNAMMNAVNSWGFAHGRFYRLGKKLAPDGPNRHHSPKFHIDCFLHPEQTAKLGSVTGGDRMTPTCTWSAKAIYDEVTDTYNVDYKDCVHNHDPVYPEVFPEYRTFPPNFYFVRLPTGVQSAHAWPPSPESTANGFFPPFASEEVILARKQYEPDITKGFSPLEALLHTMDRDGCHYSTSKDRDGRIRAVVWGDMDIVESDYLPYGCWAQFPEVLCLNFTCKSSQFNIPLLEASFRTNGGTTYYAFFAYVSEDTLECFTTALSLADGIRRKFGIEKPKYVISGDNANLRKAVKTVWKEPDTKWMLCSWHLYNDVLKFMQKSFKNVRGKEEEHAFSVVQDVSALPEQPKLDFEGDSEAIRQARDQMKQLEWMVMHSVKDRTILEVYHRALCTALKSTDPQRAVSELLQKCSGARPFYEFLMDSLKFGALCANAEERTFESEPVFEAKVPEYLMGIMSDFKGIAQAPTEKVFMDRWREFKTKYESYPVILEFLKDNYICRRSRWAEYSLLHNRNYGQTCCGSVVKGRLLTHKDTRKTSVWRIYLLLKQRMNNSMKLLREDPADVWVLYFPPVVQLAGAGINPPQEIITAFDRFLKAVAQAKNIYDRLGINPLPPCPGILRDMYGLPCAHSILEAWLNDTTITVKDFASRWQAFGGSRESRSRVWAEREQHDTKRRRIEGNATGNAQYYALPPR